MVSRLNLIIPFLLKQLRVKVPMGGFGEAYIRPEVLDALAKSKDQRVAPGIFDAWQSSRRNNYSAFDLLLVPHFIHAFTQLNVEDAPSVLISLMDQAQDKALAAIKAGRQPIGYDTTNSLAAARGSRENGRP
jgi:hypothetical protein